MTAALLTVLLLLLSGCMDSLKGSKVVLTTGFEKNEGELTGGIQATGNYPGKATTPDRGYVLHTPGSHGLSGQY